MSNNNLDIKSLVADLRGDECLAICLILQFSYIISPPMTQSHLLKLPHHDGELPLSCSEIGTFNLKELVSE